MTPGTLIWGGAAILIAIILLVVLMRTLKRKTPLEEVTESRALVKRY